MCALHFVAPVSTVNTSRALASRATRATGCNWISFDNVCLHCSQGTDEVLSTDSHHQCEKKAVTQKPLVVSHCSLRVLLTGYVI